MIQTVRNLDYKWFRDNQKKLFSQFPDKFLIISDCKVLGTYDTFEEAMVEALKKRKAGEFLIQQCVEVSSPIQYHNRAVYFK